MKRFAVSLLLLVLTCLLSCRQLASESGLYNVPLEHTYKLGVDGIWLWGKGDPYPGATRVRFYVAPLNIDLVKKKNPEMAAQMVPQMHDYMLKYLAEALEESNRANHTQWELTEDPGQADIRVDMAVVRLRRQLYGLRILSKIGGFFSPIPGISGRAEAFAKGDICIEGTVRSAKDNALLMAFKDSNRKSTRIYTAEAFSRTGHADVNLEQWAKNLARMVRAGAQDKARGRTFEQRLRQESLDDTIKRRAKVIMD